MSYQSPDPKYEDIYRETFEFLFEDLLNKLSIYENNSDKILTSPNTLLFLNYWTDIIERASRASVHAYHNILRQRLLESGIDIGEF